LQSGDYIPHADAYPSANGLNLFQQWLGKRLRAMSVSEQKSELFNCAGLMIHISAVIYPIARNVNMRRYTALAFRSMGGRDDFAELGSHIDALQ